MYYSRICHYCKHCTGTHNSTHGLPNAHCSLKDKAVIEFGMVCDVFEMASNPASRDPKPKETKEAKTA